MTPHGACIAIVDDDPAVRQALSSLIRSVGFTVALFETAETFLESLERTVPACVLTDVQMPGMSGFDLQETLARSHPKLAVVMMTAFPAPGLRERALAAGAREFLKKPFDAEALLALLRDATG